jgi:hypothetical protein
MEEIYGNKVEVKLPGISLSDNGDPLIRWLEGR